MLIYWFYSLFTKGIWEALLHQQTLAAELLFAASMFNFRLPLAEPHWLIPYHLKWICKLLNHHLLGQISANIDSLLENQHHRKTLLQLLYKTHKKKIIIWNTFPGDLRARKCDLRAGKSQPPLLWSETGLVSSSRSSSLHLMFPLHATAATTTTTTTTVKRYQINQTFV